jgi:cell pole-organizing protein PopZ
MEEILASIRRIISEDDTPDAAEGAPAAAPAEEPPAAESVPEELPIVDDEAPIEAAAFDDEEELELTEKVESHGDLDVYSPSAAPEPADEPEADMGGLVSASAAAAAAAAFGQLSGKMLMPAAGRTLEDVVRELLRPLLQNWLDENLPGIVQRAVDAEVSRIARGG